MWRIEQAGLNLLVTDTSRIVPIGESGSPDEKLHFGFLSLIARHERERNGRTISSGRLVPDEAEANVVRVIYKLFLDGSGPTVISRWLNANTVLIPTGSATKQAGQWWGDRARPSLGASGGARLDHADPRAAASRRREGPGDPVPRRRGTRGDGDRDGLEGPIHRLERRFAG